MIDQIYRTKHFFCFYYTVSFSVPRNVRINSAQYFIKKLPHKKALPPVTFNHLSGIGYEDFMNLYKKCTAKPYSFFVIDTPLPSDNLSHFRKNLLERT